jgi:hypothetical protein
MTSPLERFRLAFADAEYKVQKRNLEDANIDFSNHYDPLYTDGFEIWWTGRHLLGEAMQTRVIPRDKAKFFEKAHKLFHMKRRPRNWTVWYLKNRSVIQTTIREVPTWPEKSVAGGREVQVGNIKVHNQTSKENIEGVVDVLKDVIRLVQKAGVPRASELLYGDVFIVGDIERKKNILALYYHAKDSIALLLKAKYTNTQERSLIHEFGHRYWDKFMDAATRNEWVRHHKNIAEVQKRTIKAPGVGDEIPVTGSDKKVLEIRAVRGTLWYITQKLPDDKWMGVPVERINKFLIRKHIISGYPTTYSSTNAEEHFCDAFALYVQGELPEVHLNSFRKILRATNPSKLAVRLRF